MRSRMLMTLIPALLVAAATPSMAQLANHANHADHMMPGAVTADLPTEPGDSAFAAISEIVVILSGDPETDWSRVDIDALREHLVDMNQLVLGASVRTETLPDGLRMRIGTTGRAGEAASRMVPAHGPVLAAETGWMSDVTRDGTEIVWTVKGRQEDVARIRALGFFGLMATGDHHRAHHLALARGEPVH